MSGTPPSGIGMFIWESKYCEGGDWTAITTKAKASGLSWLVFHNFWDTAAAQQLQAAGFYVAYSFFTEPGAGTAAEIESAKNAWASGACNAVLFDAETAWETNAAGEPQWRGPEATAFVQALRAAVGPDCFLANAGAWQEPKYHPDYPDREFAAVADAAMPERYWTEVPPGMTYAQIMEDSESEWKTYPDVQGYKSVIPIGSCYGTNGPVPGGHRPLEPADLEDFIKRYPTSAMWSWMHMPSWGWTLLQSLNSNIPVA